MRRSTGLQQAPDLIEPIVGWRLWLVVPDGGYLWLESVLYRSRWSPRRPHEARCVQHRRCYFCNSKEVEAYPTHAAPDPECDCGIYAARSPESLARYLDSTYPGRGIVERVLGRVRLWGRVVAGEHGWRGQCAYPDALFVPTRTTAGQRMQPTDVAAALRDYGVPVLLLGDRTTPELIASLREAA